MAWGMLAPQRVAGWSPRRSAGGRRAPRYPWNLNIQVSAPSGPAPCVETKPPPCSDQPAFRVSPLSRQPRGLCLLPLLPSTTIPALRVLCIPVIWHLPQPSEAFVCVFGKMLEPVVNVCFPNRTSKLKYDIQLLHASFQNASWK